MTESPAYQVLARKYRPKTFADLIGQDVLVRTLTHAIAQDRLAHAYILTGVRGIGKTSTARIIAKCLNGRGVDGNGPPSISPDPKDENVIAIEQGRHVDVLEMDAASRTGVGDIREIIETVQYRPAQAKYKIYIIDEVHMLSNAAFNALLKTLEEPPPHIKFIFATTEIRKVPVTVLSRCQRFDLRRIETDVLKAHLEKITALEGGTIEDAAAMALARAADGSVRDGLSLLDQALVVGNKNVTFSQIEEMLGLVDKNQIYDLLEATLNADAEAALDKFSDLYAKGADPLLVIQDLLDLTHWLMRLKVTPASARQQATETDLKRGGPIAEKLNMGMIGRQWQVLLKAVQEIQQAPNPVDAAEMVLMRLCYMSALPTPQEAIESLNKNPPAEPARPKPPPAGVTPQPEPPAQKPAAVAVPVAPSPVIMSPLRTFTDIVRLFEEKKEASLTVILRESIYPVQVEPGKIIWREGGDVPAGFAQRIRQHLRAWTGQDWGIETVQNGGEKTLAEGEKEAYQQLETTIQQDPLVQDLLKDFPKARITGISARKADA